MPQIVYDDFAKIDIRVGVVVKAEASPKALKPAYKMWIDFGDLGVKTSSAQITTRYKPDDLVGRSVLAVVNLPPAQVADFMSEVLVLGAVVNDADVVLVGPDTDVAPGARIW